MKELFCESAFRIRESSLEKGNLVTNQRMHIAHSTNLRSELLEGHRITAFRKNAVSRPCRDTHQILSTG
jgi:hypothetical protein